MRNYFLIILCSFSFRAFSQQLELHYDFRHTIDPKRQNQNYPTLFFEYFRSKDWGSTLFKIQADLKGTKGNMGQSYLQVAQTFKIWKPKVYLNIGYSGGLGIIESINGGFYISNAYVIGGAYPFQAKNAWFSSVLCYKYTGFSKPSHDIQATFYFGKGIRNYKYIVSGSLIAWSENRNQGNDYTKNLSGKKFVFYGDPQIWWNVGKGFSIGSKINLFYHVLTDENILQIYPTAAIKYKFE